MSFRGAPRGRGTGANFGGGGGRGGGGFGGRGGQQFESHTARQLLIDRQDEVGSSKETMDLQPTFLVRILSDDSSGDVGEAFIHRFILMTPRD